VSPRRRFLEEFAIESEMQLHAAHKPKARMVGEVSRPRTNDLNPTVPKLLLRRPLQNVHNRLIVKSRLRHPLLLVACAERSRFAGWAPCRAGRIPRPAVSNSA
jgi:hypothetical protein